MSYCSKCGKYLEANEICDCMNQQNTDSPVNLNKGTDSQQDTRPNFPQGGPPVDNYGRPLFTPQGQPIMYDQYGNPVIVQPPKKKSGIGCIIGVVILILFLITIIFGIILVPAMVGYTTRSKLSRLNNDAKIVSVSANTVVTEMSEEGNNFNGTFIISSNDYQNKLFDCDVNVNKFRSKMEDYLLSFDDGWHCDWFVVVQNGTACYAAVEKDNKLGTMPASPSLNDVVIYSPSGSIQAVDASGLNELYENTCKTIEENLKQYS